MQGIETLIILQILKSNQNSEKSTFSLWANCGQIIGNDVRKRTC